MKTSAKCTWLVFVSTCLWWGVSACGPESAEQSPAGGAAMEEGPTASFETTAKHLSQPRDHWLVAGTGSHGVTVDANGQPKVVSGRFVNKGTGVNAGSMGSHEWLVASRSGWVQLIDSEGIRSGEARELFDGNGQMRFVTRGSGNWLAGGTSGKVQRLDRYAQPTQDMATPFGGETVTAAGYGASGWLVGSANGEFRHLDPDGLEAESPRLSHSSSAPVVDIISTSQGVWLGFTATEMTRVTTNRFEWTATLAEHRAITTVAVQHGTILVGSDDGHVLAGSVPDLREGRASWQKAFDGEAIRALGWNGTTWLAVGDGGQARTIAADGTPEGSSAKTLAGGRDLGAARGLSEGWMVGVADLSAVHTVGANLEPSAKPDEMLGGASIIDLAVGTPGYLAVGDGGEFRLFDVEGSPKTSLESIEAVDAFTAAGWSGENFLAAADDGKVVAISAEGEPLGEPIQPVETKITDLSWNGTVWLATLADGQLQRLREQGSLFRDPLDSKLDRIEVAGFNGDEWIVVGSRQAGDTSTANAAYAIVTMDFKLKAGPKIVSDVEGSFHAVGWNGHEWLAGGAGGYTTRIDQSGGLIEAGTGEGTQNVLHGMTVRTIDFNEEHYLIGGDNGTIRRLEFDAKPIGTAFVVNGFARVTAAPWAAPIGYPGGSCISSSTCLEGTCKNNASESSTFCCESTCDGPCESCLQADTGKPNGICEPIPEGEEPPGRKTSSGNSCHAQSEETCGTTGVCNGNGQCATYGSETTCRSASCRAGQLIEAATCSDDGSMCPTKETTSCEPYTCASDAPECRSSCKSNDHCAGGYACQDGSCVEKADDNEDESQQESGDDQSGGGCSVPAGEAGAPGLFQLVFGLLAGAALVRRHTFSEERL